MTTWKLQKMGKIPPLNKPIMIEGLPGIGNVGKVALDFLVEELKAKKIFSFISYTFPHSVFVNEQNLVELPRIELYYKKFNDPKKRDLLLLGGDIQPIDEVSCYEFCETLLDLHEKLSGSDVITLGGIGLQSIPKKPKVYCTGWDKNMIQEYVKGTAVDTKLYGVVGPIVGVSGVLLGLAARRKMRSVTYLAETFGHPMYLGVKGSKEMLFVLKKKLGLEIDLKKMEADIEDLEREVMKKTKELTDVSRSSAIRKLKERAGEQISYIG